MCVSARFSSAGFVSARELSRCARSATTGVCVYGGYAVMYSLYYVRCAVVQTSVPPPECVHMLNYGVYKVWRTIFEFMRTLRRQNTLRTQTHTHTRAPRAPDVRTIRPSLVISCAFAFTGLTSGFVKHSDTDT